MKMLLINYNEDTENLCIGSRLQNSISNYNNSNFTM